MSKRQKLISKIKNNPGDARFQDLRKLLLDAGFEESQPRNGSSHRTYRKPNAQKVTLRKTGKPGKAYTLEVLDAIGE